MFISTVDNVEFCCGKYYSNEEDLLKGEQDIRKSTRKSQKIMQISINEK